MHLSWKYEEILWFKFNAFNKVYAFIWFENVNLSRVKWKIHVVSNQIIRASKILKSERLKGFR